MANTLATTPIRDKHAVIGERPAKRVLGPIVTLLGVICIFLGIFEMLRATFHTVVLIIDIQILGAIVQFWASRSYKDGVSGKEVLAAVFWEVGLFRNKRAGQNWLRSLSNHQAANTVNKPAERKAFWWGLLLSVVIGGGVTYLGIHQIGHTFSALVWFGVAIWGIGIAFNFWKSGMWRGGVTFPELLGTVIWPLGIVATRVKRRRLRRQLTADTASQLNAA